MLLLEPDSKLIKAVAVISIAAVCSSIAASNALLEEFPSLPNRATRVRQQLRLHDKHSKEVAAVEISEGRADTIDSGARIWESGRALSNWMVEHLEPGRRILELGAGTGIVGLTAAAVGGAQSVVLTDQPDMVPLLEQNIASNNLRATARAAPLLWGCDRDEAMEALNGVEARGGDPASSSSSSIQQSPIFDVVCGSDILYSPENFPLLFETLCQVCTPSTTEVLLAYPRRFTEDLFFDTASDCFEISSEEEIEPNVFLTKMRMTSS